MGVLYVDRNLLLDINQRVCSCIADYYFFEWQGLITTALMVIFLIFLFLWTIFFQDEASEKKKYQKLNQKGKSSFKKFFKSPYVWIILIFVYIWGELILINLFLQVFIKPNFNQISDNWIIFGGIYAFFCSFILYYLIRMYINTKLYEGNN